MSEYKSESDKIISKYNILEKQKIFAEMARHQNKSKIQAEHAKTVLSNGGEVFIVGEYGSRLVMAILFDLGVKFTQQGVYSKPLYKPIYGTVFGSENEVVGFEQSEQTFLGRLIKPLK